MGTVTTTAGPYANGSPKTVTSRGGMRIERKITKNLMGATYATGGDTVTKPDAPPGGTLIAVQILADENRPAGISMTWNGSASTPKILAYDEDNTSGIEAELTNANAALAAVVVWLEWIYTVG